MTSDWRNFEETVSKIMLSQNTSFVRIEILCKVRCCRMSENVLTVSKYSFWNELMLLFWLFDPTFKLIFFQYSLPLKVELMQSVTEHLCLN